MKQSSLFLNENKRIYHALFILMVALLFAYKFHDLFLPYFWDELGVYSQAAYYQYLHRLSLMPSSVPVEYSRGHPLLFTFCNACIFKIFGPQVLCAHLFNLFIAICLLSVLYVFVSKYSGSTAAIISCAFLVSQPVFLAQSCLMLPEIMLALFAILALICFYEEKYWGFAVFSSLAILTKETAIILPGVALVYSFIRSLWLKQKSSAFKPVNIFFILLPYLVFSGFLLIQKSQNGWYFFPYHIDNLTSSFDSYKVQFNRFFNFIFWDQGRRFWIFAIIVGIFFSIYKKGFRFNSLLLLMALFIIVFILFSSINFYMERYVMIALIPFSLITGVLVSAINENKIFTSALVIVLCAVSFPYLEPKNFNYDADMGYRKQVATLQNAIDYVAEISDDKKVVYGNFPGYYAINFPVGGYLKNKKINAAMNLDDKVDYFIFSNPGDGSPPDSGTYKAIVLQTFKNGFAEVKVYSLEKR